ncbi:MAG: hypothetical protein DRH30_02555 [Deltaproteobacteria bacterium]|nr:MAG: hypothetical protein DRH30_02555 [Deltaproteobacteria bacterium]
MALYSVWDWDRNSWRVYKTSTPVSVGEDAIPPKPSSTSPIGADPDTQVKALPRNATLSGYSHVARGEVRRMSGGLGDAGDDGGKTGFRWMTFGAGAAVASAFWWWRKRK